MDVEELASHMGQTGDLADRSDADEAFEPRVAIDVHPAAEVGQMALGMAVLAVGGEPVLGRRRPSPHQGRSARNVVTRQEHRAGERLFVGYAEHGRRPLAHSLKA